MSHALDLRYRLGLLVPSIWTFRATFFKRLEFTIQVMWNSSFTRITERTAILSLMARILTICANEFEIPARILKKPCLSCA